MIARTPVALPEIAEDVRAGLTRRPKSLPPKLFYDAAGSALFERITELPEYYLTRTERAILERHAEEICALAAGPEEELQVVELGAGSAAKTRILLQALLRRQPRVVYSPVDVSRSALEAARRSLQAALPQVEVRPLVADITGGLRGVLRGPTRKLVLYIGSSIGNFEPGEAVALLARLRAALAPGDALLLGTDLVKPVSVLLPAYDDDAGVTAAFNKNVLARINRELGGHFDLGLFRHVARWNRRQARIEIYLESRVAQVVPIDLLRLCVRFAAGETIHTENSYKYTLGAVRGLLRQSGLRLEDTWRDPRRWFAVHLARVH